MTVATLITPDLAEAGRFLTLREEARRREARCLMP